MNNFFEFKKSYKYLLNTTFLITIIYFAFENKEFLEVYTNYKNLKLENLYIITLLIIFRIFTHSYQTVYLYKIGNIDLSILESANLYLRTILGNFLSVLQPGSAYKISYLKIKYNLPIKKFFGLNIGLTAYRVLIFLIFALIYAINNQLISSYFFGILFSVLFFLPFLIRFIVNKISKKNELQITKSLFLKLNFILFVQLVINVFILEAYFKLLGVNAKLFEILLFLIVAQIADVVKLTPGNFGYREVILIFFESLHKISPSNVLAVSFFIRGFELFYYLILTLLFSYLSKDNEDK